jgi:hypothetical protein
MLSWFPRKLFLWREIAKQIAQVKAIGSTTSGPRIV